jgi:hypothetical protein
MGPGLVGGFVAFRPSADGTNSAKVLEDGFVVELSEASAKRVRQALQQGDSLDLLQTGGRWAFTLRCLAREEPKTPLVTGSPTVEIFPNGVCRFEFPPGHRAATGANPAQSGWQSYGSSDWMPEVFEWPVSWALNYWHHSLADVEKRVQVAEFQEWMRALGRTVTEFFIGQPAQAGCNLCLTWAVWPTRKARFWIDLSPNRGQARVADGLRRRLHQLPLPSVTAPLLSSAAFLVWGGGGVMTQPLITTSWQAEFEGPGGITDEILQRLYPI